MRVAAAVVIAFALPACGGDASAPAPENDCADERERPFCREVADAQRLSASERARKLVDLARELEPASRTKLLRGGRTVYELARELLAREDYAVLRALGDGLTEHRLDVLVTALRAKADRPPVRALLADLAERDPENVRLMAFREGGIETLLQCVEDTTAYATRRRACVFELGLWADESVLDRLRRLENDESPFEGPETSDLIGSTEVLGDRVRAAMEQISRRAGK